MLATSSLLASPPPLGNEDFGDLDNSVVTFVSTVCTIEPGAGHKRGSIMSRE